MRYAIFYCGGEGPDVWDKEDTIDAVDIDDALSHARRLIEDNSGWIYSIEQFEYPSQSARHQLKLCEEHAATMAKDFDASLAVVQTERDSLRLQLQTAMEERDALIAAAKCQNEFEVLVEKESYKNLRPDEAKRLEELQAVMNKAADIVEPMAPPIDLLSRLSTSRSTENKT